jgi:hypothetical protein
MCVCMNLERTESLTSESMPDDWTNARLFRASDLQVLIFALAAAHAYIANTSLPGDSLVQDDLDAHSAAADEIAM